MDKLDAFIAKWSASGGEERANKDAFLIELCHALDLPPPDPKTGDDARDLYVFEKDVVVSHERGRRSTRKMDLYRHDSFLLEAKQGSNKGAKKLGTAKRDTPQWHQAMHDAYGQALGYISFLDAPPPFIITCDIGYCFDLYADFDRSRRYEPFPSAQRKRIYFRDLAQHRELFQTIFVDPLSLDPSRKAAEATREIAASLADLARRLEAAGHDQHVVARFLMRCIFTMFAEDVGLLPEHAFTEAIRKFWLPNPASFPVGIEQLWRAMNEGGHMFGVVGRILRFNGGLFTDVSALPLDAGALALLLEAADRDWSQVEPAIFGTLLERALDPRERHRLGAHYTPRSYVERLVRPTIEEPLRADWNVVQAHVRQLVAEAQGAKTAQAEKLRKQAVKEVREFHRSLCSLRVLDPACGTGNFLYVTMDLFRRIENEVLTLLDSLGERGGLLGLEGVRVTPAQFLGIEIKPWAKEIAELVLWIGYLQGQLRSLPPRKKGEPPPVAEPVLQDYKNIECRDAILAHDPPELVRDERGKPVSRWDGETFKKDPSTGAEVPDESARAPLYRYPNPRKAEWPKTDFIVGNPPFLGNKKMKRILGVGYTETLREIYKEMAGSADLVMYWWYQAAQLLHKQKIRQFGLITTNSIIQSFNRVVVEDAMKDGKISISFAIPDHPWSEDETGAAVRIAMTVGSFGKKEGLIWRANVQEADKDDFDDPIVFRGHIKPDLSLDKAGEVYKLKANHKMSFMGVTLGDPGFLVPPSHNLATTSLAKPFLIGRDINQKPDPKIVLDTWSLGEQELMTCYPNIFQHLLTHVKPRRDQQTRPSYKKNWWLPVEPRGGMRQALSRIARFIATCRTAVHRVFLFVPINYIPESTVIAIASDDAFLLAVLSSKIHIVWTLRSGSVLENRPRYNNSLCFDPFPFPDPSEPLRQRIRQLGEQLDAFRKQRQAEHPELTITDMYNVLEKLRRGEKLEKKEPEIHAKGLISTLKKIHDDLDAAVFEAYGWPSTLTDEEILEKLVALNAERAEEERQGKVRWLRPEYQNPQGASAAAQMSTPEEEVGEETEEGEEGAAAPKRPAWPKKTKEQIVAVRDLLTRHTEGWTVAQVAAQFKGASTEEAEECLESLEALGLLVSYTIDKERHWRSAAARASEAPAMASRRTSAAPPAASEAQRLAEQLRALRTDEKKREASDLAVATIDGWLRGDRLDNVKELLETLDPEQINPAATLAILASTHPVKATLKEREIFVLRAKEALPKQLDPRRAERLMAPCL